MHPLLKDAYIVIEVELRKTEEKQSRLQDGDPQKINEGYRIDVQKRALANVKDASEKLYQLDEVKV